MNAFGFRIRNHGPAEVMFHHGGRRTPIPVRGSVECEFPAWYGPEEAFDQLEDVVLQLAASVCARTRFFEFDIQPTEFGFHLVSREHGAYEIELLDDDPCRFHFANGECLTTEGPLAPDDRPRRS
ncbi:MAG: hypothetical protein ACREFX_09590 [Opitutaceae bacterium]